MTRMAQTEDWQSLKEHVHGRCNGFTVELYLPPANLSMLSRIFSLKNIAENCCRETVVYCGGRPTRRIQVSTTTNFRQTQDGDHSGYRTSHDKVPVAKQVNGSLMTHQWYLPFILKKTITATQQSTRSCFQLQFLQFFLITPHT